MCGGGNTCTGISFVMAHGIIAYFVPRHRMWYYFTILHFLHEMVHVVSLLFIVVFGFNLFFFFLFVSFHIDRSMRGGLVLRGKRGSVRLVLCAACHDVNREEYVRVTICHHHTSNF